MYLLHNNTIPGCLSSTDILFQMLVVLPTTYFKKFVFQLVDKVYYWFGYLVPTLLYYVDANKLEKIIFNEVKRLAYSL